MKSSREQFEEWFDEYTSSAPGRCKILRAGIGYRNIACQEQWEAWQASRAAIEIELKQFDHFQICHYVADEKYADGYIDAQNNASKAIDFAGLKVKS